MARTGGAPVADAVRVLASPVFVLSLVVLALNDHVLKQAWPGLVTGKLSDVAGLVVAPLLLAVPLAAIGVRRPVAVAIALTGIGFVFAKTSVAGAEVTSAVWSLTGMPTLMRADVTDLVALPALALAWWVDRRARSSPELPWRRAVATAVGMALLPVAVLATAATSCDEGMRVTGVSRVKADFRGRPREREQRLVLDTRSESTFTIDTTRTIQEEPVEVSPMDETVREQCDPMNRSECWRIPANDTVVDNLLADGVEVEHSLDGGRTWELELELSSDDLEAIREDTDGCGGPDRIAALDLGVLPSDGEPVVVVPIGKGGAIIRDEDAQWELHSRDWLLREVDSNTSESPPTRAKPLDQPSGGPTGEVTPTCANPSPTTVTPNPRNGPPTTYDVCLDSP